MVPRIQSHRLAELIARCLGLAYLEQGIGQVDVDVGAFGSKFNGVPERRDRVLVMPGAQGFVRLLQRLVRGIGRLCSRDSGQIETAGARPSPGSLGFSCYLSLQPAICLQGSSGRRAPSVSGFREVAK